MQSSQSEDCIGEESQSSKCICGSRTRHKLFSKWSSLKAMVVSETSSEKNVKRKDAPIGQIAHIEEEFLKVISPQSSMDRVSDEESSHDLEYGMIRAARELDYFSAHIRLREPDKSKDKAECKATDSRAMGLAAPWYRRGGTSMESSIPCSHGGRALVVKEVEKVENTKINFKYQDRAEGQRPRNFIRPMSMGFSSR
ncbi:hypothetical protein B296_00052145 [Ensete ventricosum]|uniref:Uncharacterized protein n=1 Tax=Ensete ventricosum TaxID=4639 RepID=A0A426WXD4_ENSVE|nr:hypothetical protein B296_00052145 [Ensete ventricosum]